MPTVWITHPHNLHCPSCGEHLVVEAGRYDVIGGTDPIYRSGPDLLCPRGHQLPAEDELYAQRDAAGLPQEVEPHEVPRPS